MMKAPQNRFLLELDKFRSDVNREILGPRIDTMTIERFRPIITLVAHARADYMEALIAFGEEASQEAPDLDRIKELKHKREAFDELVAAANALETVIQRDYIDSFSTKGAG